MQSLEHLVYRICGGIDLKPKFESHIDVIPSQLRIALSIFVFAYICCSFRLAISFDCCCNNDGGGGGGGSNSFSLLVQSSLMTLLLLLDRATVRIVFDKSLSSGRTFSCSFFFGKLYMLVSLTVDELDIVRLFTLFSLFALLALIESDSMLLLLLFSLNVGLLDCIASVSSNGGSGVSYGFTVSGGCGSSFSS